MPDQVRFYTTEVPVEQTMSEVGGLLRQYGVRRFSMDYDEESGEHMLRFALPDSSVPGGMLPVRLAPKLGPVRNQLAEKHNITDAERVQRVAWRQLKAILEGILLNLDGGPVSVAQLFLGMTEVPDGRGGTTTVYELMKLHGSHLLTGGK